MAPKFKKNSEAEVKDATIPKYTGVTGGKDIVSIVSDEHTWPLETHYVEGYGSFHCFKGQCCLDYPKTNISYILPLLKYKMTGNKLEYTKPVEFMYLKASKDLYKQIQNEEEAGGVLPETDYLFNCSDAGYQKIKLTEMKTKNGSVWKNDKELVGQVKEFLKSYELLIEKAVKIKPMDAEKYSGLYESEEYLRAIASFQQKQTQGGGYNNNNNRNQPQIQQGYGSTPMRQISASPSQGEVVVDIQDFDALIDEDI